jgi:hypothetical protein
VAISSFDGIFIKSYLTVVPKTGSRTRPVRNINIFRIVMRGQALDSSIFDVYRIHNRPTFSQTILLQNLYINPQNSAKVCPYSHEPVCCGPSIV